MTASPMAVIRGRYRLEKILGEGAHARTWLAVDTLLEGDGEVGNGEAVNSVRVALKELPISRLREWKQLELFEREAEMLAELDHPGIPHLYDHFLEEEEQGTTYYIVEEWIDGNTLARQLKARLLRILVYLHSREPKVVHRDIKPSNVMVRADGELVLIDFGAVREAASSSSEQGSTVVGTFGYMPPEQLHGSVRPASDMYSLAATICHLLTGRSPKSMAMPHKPFGLDFRDHCHVSPALASMLDAMLEPDVSVRLKDVREALLLLDEVEGTPPLDEPLADLALIDGQAPVALQAPRAGPRLMQRDDIVYAFGLPPLWRYLLPIIGAALLVTGIPGAILLIVGIVTSLLNVREGYSNYEILAEGTIIPARIMSREERFRGYEIEYVYAYDGGKYRATINLGRERGRIIEVGSWIQVAIDPDSPSDNVPLLDGIEDLGA